jgi:cobalt/nickel transport protein
MKKTAVILAIIAILIVLAPLFFLRGAEFEGTDGQGSELVEEISEEVTGEEFEPVLDPLIETIIGGEIPAEIETLLFCIQTAIGVGVLAYCFGYLVARKKYSHLT